MSTSPLSTAQAARKALAERLGELRKDAGLTVRELGVRCGWSESKTSRIESAKTGASDADIRAWCAACGADALAPDLIAASRTAESMYIQWRRRHRSGRRSASCPSPPFSAPPRAHSSLTRCGLFTDPSASPSAGTALLHDIAGGAASQTGIRTPPRKLAHP
ncbi:helix-turn-helix domain-containing protein [Streptomyces niveus]